MRLVVRRVEGVEQAKKELERQGRTVSEALTEVVPVSAEAISDEARRLVPKDSGDLHDQIGYRVDGNEAEVKIMDATRGSGTYYGHFVEFGTSRQPAQPFMGPAADLERSRMRSRVQDAIEKGARRAK